MPEFKDSKQTDEAMERAFPRKRKRFLLLSSLFACALSFLFFTPGFETPCRWNEQGEITKVKLATYFEFLPTQSGNQALFQGIFFPVCAFLCLLCAIFALSSAFALTEEKGDKRYFFSIAAYAFINAFAGIFYLSFNHLLMMGASLISSLLGVAFLFLHYKKYVSY